MGLFSRNPRISALESEIASARQDQKCYERDQRLAGIGQSYGIRLQQQRIDRALDELHTEQEIEKYRAKD